MRIAVIGAGVAGLTCASVLHRRHEVTVFEACGYAGGHANTVEVDLPEGRVAVDTGFIVYNERNYPRFSAMLERLEVATQPSDMSFSVCDESSGLEYKTTTPNSLFARRSNLARPGYHRMLADLLRFNRAARRRLERGEDSGATLGEVLDAGRYGAGLREWFVVPLASAIWSADPADVLAMPFTTWARFMANHGLLSLGDQPRWRTVSGGARNYVTALTRPFAHRIRLATPVGKVMREEGEVQLHLEDGSALAFDALVLACHSDQALRLLSDASRTESEVLGAIGYQENLAVLHTDDQLMPRSRRAWASWNYHVAAAGRGGQNPAGPDRRATLTYHMNRLQSIRSSSQLFVTLNRDDEVDPDRVLARFEYAHPVLDRAAVAAQRRRHELQGVRRTWYCGAYWGYGFHEDGVASAHDVCELLGERP